MTDFVEEVMQITTTNFVEVFEQIRYALRRNNRLLIDYPAHPAVVEAIRVFGRPQDLHHLALEEPLEKEGRVTYFRNDEKRALYEATYETKHRTITSVEKYLTRHWPEVPSHKIRNLVERMTNKFEFVTDIDKIVNAVMNCTAYSCMKDHKFEAHPYRVYDPKFGWKLAIQRFNDEIVGRALVYEPEKCFVRTYSSSTNSSGYTQSSFGLHDWLEKQGYEYLDEWPEGAKFAKISPKRGAHLAPYLDPGADRASANSRRVADCITHMERNDNGEWEWCNTDGTPNGDYDYAICEDCGSREHNDDMTYVGYHMDSCVCSSCIDDYAFVIGRKSEHYYVPNDEAVQVGDGWYDKEYLDYHNIVELHNGEYAKLDDVVEVDGEWYLCSEIAANPSESGDVVEIAGDYHLRCYAKWDTLDVCWIFSHDAKEIGNGELTHDDNWVKYMISLPEEKVYNLALPKELKDEAIDAWKAANLQLALEV